MLLSIFFVQINRNITINYQIKYYGNCRTNERAGKA